MKKRNFNCYTLLISAILCFSFLCNPETIRAIETGEEGEPLRWTREEQQYIFNNSVKQVTYLDGSAPIVYTENEEMAGIMRSVLDAIEKRTGFVFEYTAVSSGSELVQEIEAGKSDIIAAMPVQYGSKIKELPHSQPFLKSETVLFMHTDTDAANLQNYVLAEIEGAELSENSKGSKVRLYKNREQALNAVASGQAGYSYTNVFSVAYYTARYGYSNVISIPKIAESRAYFLVYANDDARFVSIMDKALADISDEEMRNIILQSTANVERELSVRTFVQTYNTQVVLAVVAIIAVLALLLFLLYKSRKRYKNQNKQYLLLAGMSDEYMYEYDFKKDHLLLSDEISRLLKLPKRIENFTKCDIFKAHEELRDLIDPKKSGEEIVLRINADEERSFRLVNLLACGNQDEPCYIAGKLSDLREEKQRMQELNSKAQRDGLTGLYNAEVTRELIERARSTSDNTNAFFMIDVDRFKTINDTYGHPVGDTVLTQVAKDIKEVFRDEDIVGRIGGDEFCAFVNKELTVEVLAKKCRHLHRTGLIQVAGDYLLPTISIGAVLNKNNRADFTEMYKVADRALYEAKQKGRNSHVIYTIE